MKKKLFSIIALAVAGIMALSACGGGNSGTGSEASVAVDEPVLTADNKTLTEATGVTDKDTVIYGTCDDPITAEPGANTNLQTQSIITLFYDTLVRENKGDVADIVPMLADSWEFKDDGKTLIFDIHPNVKWHNGEELTTNDVAFSLNHALEQPANATALAFMQKAEAISDSQVAVYLNFPFTPILNILATPNFAIINQKYYEKCLEDGTNFGLNPMGTGPYKIVEWKPSQQITCDRNDDYFLGPKKMAHYIVQILGDASSGAMAIENGDIDAFVGVSGGDIARLRENDKLDVLTVKAVGMYQFVMNVDKAPFDDPKVREAMSYAINREEIVIAGHDGIGWVEDAIIPGDVLGAPGDDFSANPYDPEKAKELLSEAGYPNGFEFTIKTSESSEYVASGTVFQEQLRKIGVTANVEVMERGAFIDTCRNERDFQMFYWWQGADYPDGDAFAWKLLHSSLIGGGNNTAGVNDTELDEILLKARQSLDENERIELYRQICDMNAENNWYMPTNTTTCTIVVTKGLGGVYGNPNGVWHPADFEW